MKKLVLVLSLVLGFLLNTAAQEARDIVRYDQFQVCKKGMELRDEDFLGDYGYFMAAVVWDCVDSTSYTVKALNLLTYRPNLLTERLNAESK